MRLLVDEQTLRDLEIFEGRDGRPSLFKMFDCAKTRGGAAALRRRIAAPHADVRSITAVQNSIREIQKDLDVYEQLPGQFAVSGFEHYFHHRVAAPVDGTRLGLMFDGFMLRVDSPRDYSRIVLGVGHALLILDWFRKVLKRHRDDEPRSELGELLAEAREILARDTFERMSDTRVARAFWKVLKIDAAIRGKERDAFVTLVKLLFEIDALVSITIASAKYKLILPEVCAGSAHMTGTGLFHPFLDDSVTNPVTIEQPHRFIFVTGPNMAGKTTYLRVCGTAAYLAHIGMGVPAERLEFAPCQAFFTGIALTDDLRAGVSFFQAEAMRAHAIASALARGLSVFAILDEPFKGTNVKDALDASCAFFSRLASRDGSMFLVSSHLIEAAPTLLELGTVECKRFEAVENGETLHFDYRLKDGVSTQRLGMRVLEEQGVFRLLDNASAIDAPPP